MTVVTPSLCSKKCPLIPDHTKILEPGEYAMLVDQTRLPSDLWANCQSDGGDICFTSDSAGSNQLPMELVAINTTAQTCEIWVPLPLSIVVDVPFYVWYQTKSGTLTQPAASATYGSQAVWTTVGNYVGVWHLQNVNDSTANGYNGTSHGAVFHADKIGNGLAIPASNGHVELPSISPPSAYTFSAWINGDIAASFAGIVHLQIGSQSTTIGLYDENGAGVGLVTANTMAIMIPAASISGWTRITGTFNGTSTRAMYANGVSSGVAHSDSSYGDNAFLCGIGRGALALFKNDIDEARIRNVVDSANRDATEQQIQAGTSLITVGTPVSVSSGRLLSLRRKAVAAC